MGAAGGAADSEAKITAAVPLTPHVNSLSFIPGERFSREAIMLDGAMEIPAPLVG